MGNLKYTINPAAPRLLLTPAARAPLKARDDALWHQVHASTEDLLSKSPSEVVDRTTRVDLKLFSLGLVGWLTEEQRYHNHLLACALELAGRSWAGWTNRRYQMLAAAYAFDWLRTGIVSFSASDRRTIAAKILANATWTGKDSEYIDGHSRGNLMAQFVGALAISEGSDIEQAKVLAQLDHALDFWFGASPGAPSAIDVERHYGSGSGKGTGYYFYASWMLWNFLLPVLNGLADKHLNGIAWSRESWMLQQPRYWLHAFDRGDGNYAPVGDTNRLGNPWLHPSRRFAMAALASGLVNSSYRGEMTWLLDRQNAFDPDPPPAYERAIEWALIDRQAIPPKPPQFRETLTLLPDREYHYTSRPDDPAKSSQVWIRAEEFYKTNHAHLDCGSIQLHVEGKACLIDRNYYATSDESADYNGEAHRYFFQQTIAHSGTILVDSGETEPHRARVKPHSGSVPLLDGKGGQRYKQYDHPTKGRIYYPGDARSLVEDGGGNAWRRCERGKGLRWISGEEGKWTHLAASIAPAYATEGATTARVRRADLQWLVIHAGVIWSRPLILILHRVETDDKTNKKVLVLNPGEQGDFEWSAPAGLLGSRNVGSDNPARDGWFVDQFAYVSGGKNYLPTGKMLAAERRAQDTGKLRIEVFPLEQREEDWFPVLLVPKLKGEASPPKAWIVEPDWYGVEFGSMAFRLHKFETRAQVGDLPLPVPQPPEKPMTEQIIDNGDTRTTFTGSWKESGGTQPFGAGSLFAKDEPSEYLWRFTVDPGRYEVFAWWTEWQSRSATAKYEVKTSIETKSFSVNQQANGGRWNLLGVIDSSDLLTVTLAAPADGSSYCADAVRVRSVAEPPEPEPEPEPPAERSPEALDCLRLADRFDELHRQIREGGI